MTQTKKRDVVIAGCGGRMGKELIRQILRKDTEFDQLRLIGGVESPGHPAIGVDMGRFVGLDDIGITIGGESLLELFAKADGVIEFSSPEASVAHAGLSAQARIVHVIGTTGFTPEQQKRIQAAARHAVIVQSGNMSLGINLLAELARVTARSLGTAWDVEITDSHHRQKVDAPSGSALLLAEAVAQAREQQLKEVAEFDRFQKRNARTRGAIGMSSRRGGSIIGEHELLFAGQGEYITLTHHAENRAIYAEGAFQALLWACNCGEKRGLFSMRDVLGL